jgi:hypothetical protein
LSHLGRVCGENDDDADLVLLKADGSWGWVFHVIVYYFVWIKCDIYLTPLSEELDPGHFEWRQRKDRPCLA